MPQKSLLKLLFTVVVGVFMLWSCSQNSTSPMARTFHNVNSKYNALFQARILLKEINDEIFAAHKDNYGEIIPLLIPIDSLKNSAQATKIQSVIKKASLVPERHQNSKFVDLAYVYIATGRLLKQDYLNAIETAKYVNTTAEDEDARHAALIILMRAYVEKQEFTTALRVANLLSEAELNNDNTRDFYLTKAYLHQQNKEYKLAVAILEETYDYLPKGEPTARVHFATAQMYQEIGKNKEAAEYYALVKDNRPSYDLGFYADLNRSFIEGSLTNFDQMLKEPKNQDLLDKIYYSMASVELSKKNYKQGVNYLQLSIQNAKGDGTQKASTYLKLADLHYEVLQDYEKAKLYYDSTLLNMSTKSATYTKIENKKKYLDEFVKYQTTIKTEDSLQRLAQMNPTALDKYLEKIIKQQEDEKRKKEEAVRLAAEQAKLDAQVKATDFATAANTSSWYFYNQNLLQKGQQEFSQKWGTRPLEDNWRRKVKDSQLGFDDPNAPKKPQTTADIKNQLNDLMKNEDDKVIASKKKEYLAQIPTGKDALAASFKKQEDAYFALGKLYKQNLNEPQNAIITFEKLLTTFPKTAYEVETLYYLYLLQEGNPANQKSYKERILTQFADSYYARLVTTGSGKLTTGAEEEAQNLYAEAYNYYSINNYEDALSFVEQGLKNYPNSQVEDKFAFLRVMLVGRVKGVDEYKKALESFVKGYPKSNLQTKAKEMQAMAQKQ
jgi:tetratricopeptide (TPR) repeat protein